MQIVRRSCQAASSASRFWSPTANGSRRAFSQSNSCQRGSLPQFLEPSSPELSELLARINAKVLLPLHLTRDQEKLVYKQENRARIEAEPIEITLGEVTLPLEHIDRNRDQPSQWGSFKEAIDKSKTPEDWENIVRLLEGYNSAGVRWRSAKNFEILIRRMSLANMHHLLLKAIQRSRHTGLRLRSFPVILSLFRELHATAAVSGFETEKIERMLRFAEQYVELLEDRQHCGSRDAAPMDPRTSPYIIAIPAALAAAKAKKTSQGNDKVRLYASRLMEALQQSHNEEQLASKLKSIVDMTENTKFGDYTLDAIVRELVPLWQALKTSREVLGSDMPAAKAAKEIEKKVHDGIKLAFDKKSKHWPGAETRTSKVAGQCAKL